MIKNLPIYIDVDDVLSETGQALCRCLQNEFGKEVSFEEMEFFDLSRSYDLTPDELKHLFEVFHQPDYLLHLSPLPDAVATVRRWHDQGRIIHIVTGRPWASRDLTLEWLKNRNIPFDSFFIVDKYGREKAGDAVLSLEALSHMPYAFAVEDSPHMADFVSRQMNTPVYLIRRPWNLTQPPTTRITPVDGWEALVPLT